MHDVAVAASSHPVVSMVAYGISTPNLCREQLLRAIVNDGSSEGWVVATGTRTRDPMKKCKIS